MMLNCREATHLVSEGLDRNLGLRERFALRLHLVICAGCANFSRQAAFLRRAIAQLAERAEQAP